MPAFDLVRHLGVTVAHADVVLPRPVIYDRVHDVAFISAGLTDEARERVADELLSAVAHRDLDHRSPRR